MAQMADREAALLLRIAALDAVVERLPKTADGVRVAPNTPVWFADGRQALVDYDADGFDMEDENGDPGDCEWVGYYTSKELHEWCDVRDCYSTEQAARDRHLADVALTSE